jgi:hypothetical protein
LDAAPSKSRIASASGSRKPSHEGLLVRDGRLPGGDSPRVAQFAGAALKLVSLHSVEHPREAIRLAGASIYTGAVGVYSSLSSVLGATDTKADDRSKDDEPRDERPRNAVHAAIIA